ncbi:MAG: flagellar biosynthetic protein FliP, partial [Desulfonatronovibrio sp.]
MTRTNKNFPASCLKKLIWIIPSLILVFPVVALAQDPIVPSLSMQFSGGQASPEKVSVTLEIIFLLTVLSVAPAIVLTATSFTRLVIVFSFIRHAMGTQQMPPNQVLAALAIFLTVAIMSPVGKQINDNALQPYLNEDIDYREALSNAEDPLREFLFKHTREKDLS